MYDALGHSERDRKFASIQLRLQESLISLFTLASVFHRQSVELAYALEPRGYVLGTSGTTMVDNHSTFYLIETNEDVFEWQSLAVIVTCIHCSWLIILMRAIPRNLWWLHVFGKYP